MTSDWSHVRGKLAAELTAWVLESDGKTLASRFPEVALETDSGTVILITTPETFVASHASYLGPFEDSNDTPFAFDELVAMEGKDRALALAPTGTPVALRTVRLRQGTELDAWGTVEERNRSASYRERPHETPLVIRAAGIHPTPTPVRWTRGLTWPNAFWFAAWGVGVLLAWHGEDALRLVTMLWMSAYVLVHAMLRGFEPAALRNALWDLAIAIAWSPLVGYLVLSTRVTSGSFGALLLLGFALLGVVVCLRRQSGNTLLDRLLAPDAEHGLLVSGPRSLAGFGNTTPFRQSASSSTLLGRRAFELDRLESIPARFRAIEHAGKKLLYISWEGRDPMVEIRWALVARRALVGSSVVFAIGLGALLLASRI